jgi:transposase InsO family protein
MLGVSVAGYHEHLVRRLQIARRRHLSAEALLVHIRAVYAANRGAYGWPRIWRELHAQGIRVGKQRVQQLMQQHDIRARGRRRFRVTTTDSRHGLPIAPNLLNRNFAVAAPNSDRGSQYASHEFSGLLLKCGITASILVIDALEMAWFGRSPDRNAGHIFHSSSNSSGIEQR